MTRGLPIAPGRGIPSRQRVTVSVLLLCRQDAGILARIVQRTARVLAALTPSFEIIVCDDGSDDGTRELLGRLAASEPRLVSRVRTRRGGRGVVLREGLALAQGTVVITMDGDGRVAPENIPALLHAIKQGRDCVFGRRVERRESLPCRFRSRLEGLILSSFSGLWGRDWGCAFRAYRRHALKALLEGPELTFMLPDLLDQQGFSSVGIPVVEKIPALIGPHGLPPLRVEVLKAITRMRPSSRTPRVASARWPS